MSTDRCSCRRSAQSSSADEKIWRQTISDCYFHPPLRATPATTRVINIATAGDDASSLESLDPEESIPGFIELVTNRSPAEPRWLHRLRRGRKAVEDDQSYAFCLNLADVQRMHLRLLQGRLAWLALSAGFDDDHGASQGVLSELGPTLRDYGGFVLASKSPYSCFYDKENEGHMLTDISTSPSRSRPRIHGPLQHPAL